MNLRAASLLVGFGLQLIGVPLACACGDKFLARIDREFRDTGAPVSAAPRRATILVYRPSESHRASQDSDIALLKRVGHSVYVCDTASRCVSAVNNGDVQIVLADYRDIEALGIDSKKAHARVLPVVSKASRQDMSKLKERYGGFFDSGAPPGKLLAMVDRMLAQ